MQGLQPLISTNGHRKSGATAICYEIHQYHMTEKYGGTMPLRRAQHPRAATAAVASPGAFPYRTHYRSPLILVPWHQYKQIP